MNVNLVLFKKNGSTKAFPLLQTVTIIGRQQQCDLCIPLMVVSRKHCEINQDQGVLRVRDLGSRNGTFVNGKKVAEAVLNAGDRLQVGPVAFAVQIDGQPAEIAPSESDIMRAPEHLGDTAVQGAGSEHLETLHHANDLLDDEDNDADIFDDLMKDIQQDGAGGKESS